jgi:hypothetical protein
MEKKYKLELPDDIGIISAQWEHLKIINGKVVKIKKETGGGCAEIVQWNYYYPIFSVKKEWLKEITQPMTFDEWIQRKCSSTTPEKFNNFTYYDMKDCHEWTIENEKLKQQPNPEPSCMCYEKEKAKNTDEIYECKKCGELSRVPL